jgi:hypothetical protein
MSIFFWLPIIGVLAWIVMKEVQRQSLHTECAKSGHSWQPAGMGDHPDATYICAHCGLEW